MNPRYIIVMRGSPRRLTLPELIRYDVKQLAMGHEMVTAPLYYEVHGGRAKGPYTRAEAIQKVAQLLQRDGDSEAITRGQAADAGFKAEVKDDKDTV